jgi:GNAT acetyltransferase-like protein
MGLTAIVVDPLTDPIPAAWDDFVATERLLPLWGSQFLRTAAWCAQTPSSMVLVTEAGNSEPVALFQARHPGLLRPTRFVRPGRFPELSLADCRTPPVAVGAGMAFAAGAGAAERSAAVRVFEAALRRRAGIGGLAIAYRELEPELLPMVATGRRIRLRLGPRMVVRNRWSDPDDYVGTLARKWRSQLKKIHHTIRSDATINVDVVDTIPPADACWLAELVRRRHLLRAIPRPPLPARYFAHFAALPNSRFLTYRDANGRLLAYTALLEHGREMVLGWWGSLDLADGGRANLYFDQYLRVIRHMIQTGRERLVLGKGMEHIKIRYGAHPEPLWGVVGLR